MSTNEYRITIKSRGGFVLGFNDWTLFRGRLDGSSWTIRRYCVGDWTMLYY